MRQAGRGSEIDLSVGSAFSLAPLRHVRRLPRGSGASFRMGRKELGFWVVLKADKKVPTVYHYTIPESGSVVRMTLSMPPVQMFEPSATRIHNRRPRETFGSDDLESCRKAIKINRGIFYYLMNTYREIRCPRSKVVFETSHWNGRSESSVVVRGKISNLASRRNSFHPT
jgi:hypothetical protein